MRGTRIHHPTFGLSRSVPNIGITLLLAMFILVFLFLYLLVAAQPAHAQNSVPATARQAATIPLFASRLAQNAQRASRVPQQSRPKSSYQSPYDRRSGRQGGWLPADSVVYDNGAINGTTDAWTLNFGFAVSNTFTAPSGGASLTSMTFGAWLFPGDVLQSVEVLVGTSEFDRSISDQVISLSQSNCSGNQYGFNVCTESGNFTAVNLAGGTYWVTLENAVVNTGDPVYWDENSGPSLASENSVGTIPSEAFTLLGTSTTTTTCYPYCEPPPPPCFQYGIIHDFTIGGRPSGVSLDSEGNVYGTTGGLGENDLGLVYRLSQRVQGWLYTVLYSFTGGSNGRGPDGVIVGPDGALYGTAGGGIQNYGVVYRLRPSPVACLTALCSWNETVLYSFTGNPDGVGPNGNLVFDQAGNLYGTAGGGAYGLGTIYELSPLNGGWIEKVIYSFSGGSDGWSPNSLLMGRDGNLYGTTGAGGDPNCSYSHGTCGVVFQLAPSGDQWTERVLHTFENSPNDGASPQNLVQDSSGNLYGISTWVAGPDSGDTGGVEFMLSPSNGNWIFTELVLRYYQYYQTSFTGLASDAQGNTDVAGSTVLIYYPPNCFTGYQCDWFILGQHGWDYFEAIFYAYGLATDPGGASLYGVTESCGAYGRGTVWKR